MNTRIFVPALVLLLGMVLMAASSNRRSDFDDIIDTHAETLVEEGRQTFRFDTFGSEDFWGGTIRLHEAILGSELGGAGPGLSPAAALALGLKVDLDALDRKTVKALEKGEVDLDDPAVTVALLKVNAVVGVTGFFEGEALQSVGIQCALCHSTVDNSLAPGVGRRLDGWANRDLDIGAIVATAPDLNAFANLLGTSEETVRSVLRSWGPGKFDAELVLDGKAFRPDGKTAATLLPPAFGLAGVNLHTWTGWGSVTHWNAFVANLEMHGKGTFFDPRLDDAATFPIAAQNGFGHVVSDPDLITPKLNQVMIHCSLSGTAGIDLAVFDVAGRRVTSLAQGTIPPGEHSVRWDLTNAAQAPVSPGVYFCRLTVNGVQAAVERIVTR